MNLDSNLISAAISAIVSFFVGVFFSDKSVERSQLKRLHSLSLQSSIRTWVQKIDNLCKIGQFIPLTEFSHEDGMIKPIVIGDLASEHIPHRKFLISHMESGYNEVWTQWNELKQQINYHNLKKAKFLEDVRQEFMQKGRDLKLTEYYHKPGHSGPRVFFAPDRIAENILKEITNRITGIDDWWGGEPEITESRHGDTLIYSLKIFDSTYMMDDINSENIISIIALILSRVKDEEIINEVEDLLKMNEINYRRVWDIKEQLNEIISIIELGHNIKGKCKYCPKFLWIF